MKRTKTIKIGGVLILILLLSTRIWAQSSNSEQLVVPLSDPGKPYKLNAHLVSGSITLVSYEGKDILIDAQSGDEKSGRVKEAAIGMRRLSPANSLDVTAEENNNQVNIHSSMGNKNINLTIKVPRNDVKLKLNTVNNGDINVSNVSGELEVTNVNGSIKLNNVSGSVVANTVNGEVNVKFKAIDPKAAMAFSTLNGNVDVTFPATLKANVKLKSDRGDIYTDFDVVTNTQQKPAVSRNNKAGMYSLKIDDWVYGKIEGGGPEMMMKNMNGNIYIRKTK
ncbi:DUF4097 family beta strand repeat-containing protein [Mucilaginibacter sabulilitoris]|uniref:DUF4097 family beta strand repeat-containing protein n=1 Tax=Mucilaginibacter sabulilitoris TaxID=1173583 RepID=A0ABZ0THB8_9SPHI|nr:DUF4097 family beta strand repeat-containing protein [Mucilaginibacter sabulilitoris]WPU91986.1 DUF4097 family beta strand repeat-containing protein [Mucilaginibacter sabulilitoris]